METTATKDKQQNHALLQDNFHFLLNNVFNSFSFSFFFLFSLSLSLSLFLYLSLVNLSLFFILYSLASTFLFLSIYFLFSLSFFIAYYIFYWQHSKSHLKRLLSTCPSSRIVFLLVLLVEYIFWPPSFCTFFAYFLLYQ